MDLHYFDTRYVSPDTGEVVITRTYTDCMGRATRTVEMERR